MKSELVNFLTQCTPLSEDIINDITRAATVRSYKKGDLILKEGETSNECYLVLKGCIRSYLMKDGEEITIEFYTEYQAVSPSILGKKIPSSHYLECIEDTLVCAGTQEHEMEIFRKYPQVESVCREMTEELMIKQQESHINYKSDSPEDRYLRLLKDRPDLPQRVPQYQLASYLGIKPESLSRIRKRLSKK